MRVGVKNPQEVQQFDDIEAAHAALDLRHEGLRPSEPIRNVLLQQAALLAHVREQGRDPLVAGVVDRMGHEEILDTHTTYTLSVYGIFQEFQMFQLVWFISAAMTALGIALDMHLLRANRVGLRPIGWVVASACVGPIAGVVYLIRRRAARSALNEAVWQFVGDASHRADVRRERLIALKRSGLLGSPVFRACLAKLDAEIGESTSTPDAKLPHVTNEDARRPS